MAILAYLRVSTDEQTTSSLGLDAQLDAIEKAIGPPSEVFRDEGISGSNPNRPALLAALESLEEGDTLAIAKRDRLARDTMLSCWIEKEAKKKGARIISAAGEGTEDDDPASILMRRMVDAFAEYERRLIGARTTAALTQKKARGEKTGGHTPFGYTITSPNLKEATGHMIDASQRLPKMLTPHPTEMDALNVIKRMHNQKSSLRKICTELENRGILTKTGKRRWHPQVVKQILQRA